ncbi:MAG TPA: type I DNA topoisomerase [Rhodospirillales bacterium]|nr:type I DNA topoisomerase [Rhodospirillales bacterium]
MKVVVVESPAKAKTINKYLGPGFTVLASYGHIRDLPAKDGSVRPEADFSMDWEIDPKAKARIKDIAEALRGAEHLYLATDPDREGEAISWHVREVLDGRKALKGVGVKRVVFNAITKAAIEDAFAHPRELNRELVDAYLARRALDYLVGFTLSPVLWRKLPGSRSAGRVQSVALRLICERENEIEDFVTQEYWSVKGVFRTGKGETVEAGLTHLNGQKLDKMALKTAAEAEAAVRAVAAYDFTVDKVERKQTRRNPAPPFITSTLQQEASRKLGMSATQTMRTAQRLYEGIAIDGETVGLITYMRTDGVQMAGEAIAACRDLIQSDYGSKYLPEKPRIYKSKAKNAQEAHEAIRPTDVRRHPDQVARFLDKDQARLYALIWKRTLASQMESAVLDQIAADIASPDRKVILRATGSVIAFDGFLKLYREDRDDADRDAEAQVEGKVLPDLNEGDPLERLKVLSEQHFTQPPPRYTEASLVKRLEELGIGRPSTYASIISVLQDRKYVRLESKRFVPEDRGRLVTAFLTSFFERYFAYGFTAEMEEKLDDVSGGRIDWRAVLSDFWRDFSASVDGTKDLRVKEVLDALDERLGPHFFRDAGDGRDPRRCPACADGRLNLKLGKFGAFIGCSNYPDCRHTRPLIPIRGDESDAAREIEGQGRELGTDPATGLPAIVKRGPYGYYVQLGHAGNGGEKPKRITVPRGMDPESMDLVTAVSLLGLPRTVGHHPETGEAITAGIGRFGPYIRMGDLYVSLKGDDDVLAVGLNRAVDLIAKSAKRRTPGKAIGEHPKDGKPIVLKAGRYGPYLEHNKLRATLPRDIDADAVSLEQAVAVLTAKAGASGKAAGTAKAKAAKPAAARGKAAVTAAPAETSATKKPARAAAKAEPKKVAARKGAKRAPQA